MNNLLFLGNLGTGEIIIIFIAIPIILLPLYLIYKAGKNSGYKKGYRDAIKDTKSNPHP